MIEMDSSETITCDKCGRPIADPINPSKTMLVCEQCYDRITREHGKGKTSFTIKDMDEMFSTIHQKNLLDFIS